MPGYEIRAMTAGDLDACARLAAEVDGRPPARHRARLERELAEPQRVRCLVTTAGGAVVAAARVSRFEPAADAPADVAPPGWYLIGLVVAPVHRGRGVGRALTEARVRWALERAPEVWYFTGRANTASLALHARLGFTEVTRDFSFPGATREQAGVLCRLTFLTGPTSTAR